MVQADRLHPVQTLREVHAASRAGVVASSGRDYPTKRADIASPRCNVASWRGNVASWRCNRPSRRAVAACAGGDAASLRPELASRTCDVACLEGSAASLRCGIASQGRDGWFQRCGFSSRRWDEANRGSHEDLGRARNPVADARTSVFSDFMDGIGAIDRLTHRMLV